MDLVLEVVLDGSWSGMVCGDLRSTTGKLDNVEEGIMGTFGNVEVGMVQMKTG